MHVFLWVLQILLAIHTLIGALWKFSHSAGETMPSLKAIPHGAWLALSVLEVLCVVGLVLPLLVPAGILAPIAAAFIAVEMLLFCALHLASGSTEHGPMVYWLVVAALAVFIAYGRFVLVPL